MQYLSRYLLWVLWAMNTRRRKVGQSSYIISVNSKDVGEVTKTGTHLDFYPWDWMLLDGITPYVQKNGHKYSTTGVADTLRSAMESIAAAAGAYAYKED